MEEVVVAWLVLIVLVLIGTGLVVAYFRGRAARMREDAARRARNREDERIAAMGEQQEREYAAIRSVARERSRLAYPELMDKDEANRDSGEGDWELQQVDQDRIREARELVAAELEALQPDRRSLGGWNDNAHAKSRIRELEVAADILDSVHGDPRETDGRPSKYLEEPARIIDCGEAGKVLLYTRDQVEAAREQSGYTCRNSFLKDRATAPELAKEIIERERLRKVAEAAAKREADAAITTRLDELPELPRSDIKG